MKFDYVYGKDASSSHPRITARLELITPEIANQMLETNVHNRDMKREPIVDGILEDEWKINGATIVFSDEGILLDGQNRLAACVKANKPITTFVVRGVDKESQVTMDTGIKRQLCDHLKMLNVPDYNRVATVTNALYNAKKNGLKTAFYKRSNRTTLTTLLNYSLSNIERIQFLIKLVRPIHKKFKGVGLGMLASVFDEIESTNKDIDVEFFISQLCGVYPQVQPIALLRETLIKNSERVKGRFDNEYLAALIIKAWNAYMIGSEIRCLKWTKGGAHPESFPTIYGNGKENESN